MLRGLRNGTFVRALSKEASEGYKNLHRYDELNDKSQIVKTQKKLDTIIKYKQ